MLYTSQAEQWGMVEIVLNGLSAGNPFMEVELAAQFTHGDQSIHVSGFYDGEGIHRIRFVPEIQGRWQLQTETLQEQTLETLKTAPFNKLRFCVFPKHMAYNNNEPPFYPFPGEVNRDSRQAAVRFSPFGAAFQSMNWDFTRFIPEYFRHLERILDLQQLGIEADLILFHPYDGGFLGFDHMPADVNERYLKYIVARLSALRNVWRSFANNMICFSIAARKNGTRLSSWSSPSTLTIICVQSIIC